MIQIGKNVPTYQQQPFKQIILLDAKGFVKISRYIEEKTNLEI